MKVTLDLSKLLQDGKITQAEHDRLRLLAARAPARSPSTSWSALA